MKDISVFSSLTQMGDVATGGTPTGSLDVGGSTVDKFFAEAIVAFEPTSVLEEAGIIRVLKVPTEQEKVSFPVVRNTELTWNEIKRNLSNSASGTDLGSEYNASALNEVHYKEAFVTTKSASIFLPDTVSLLNKTNFNLYADVAARDAKRKKEEDGIGSLFDYTKYSESNTLFTAGGFTGAGSTAAGSTLDPLDLVKAKRNMASGSPAGINVNVPDFVLMHPIQYAELNTHADFAPGATSNGAMMRKAKFDEDGNIVRFDGMDIFVSEHVPARTAATDKGYYGATTGHDVLVGRRGLTIARGEHFGIIVNTQDDRRRHGQWKILDIDYGYTDILVPEANYLLRCADA